MIELSPLPLKQKTTNANTNVTFIVGYKKIILDGIKKNFQNEEKSS